MDMSIKIMLPEEQKYTYTQSRQLIGQTGCIGHLRADLGSGEDFYSSWDDHRADLKKPEFKRELDEVINTLRNDILSSRSNLSKYCYDHPEASFGNDREWGLRVNTPQYSYLMRLNPNKGEYSLYCYCYRRDWLDHHMEQARRGIRFITPHYEEKFRIADGDQVRITYPDGDSRDRTARYIDDYHVEIGGGFGCDLYHICELAEILENSGATVIPLRSSLPERCLVYVESTDEIGVTLWQYQSRYADGVIEALENSFGSLEEKQGFVTSLIQIADTIVEDTVYLGAQEYEVIFMGTEQVILSDVKFPLMQQEYTREDFLRMVAENPLNDRYRHIVEAPEQTAERSDEVATPEENEPLQQEAGGNELWQDYSRIKAERDGAIVFYQVGDFYEVLGDDARIVSEALDTFLATRNVGLPERVPMCGIPVKSLELSINLLHDRGLDIAVVDDAGQVYPLPADHSQEPVNTRPVGRVDYPESSGNEAHSIEYTDEQMFLRDVLDDNHNGVPMSIVVYRQKDGSTISMEFVRQLDPPPQVEVVDYEQVRPETSLDRAKQLINDYCAREFGSAGDFDNLSKVGIAYTTLEDEEIPVQVNVNLIDCRIDRYLGKQLVDRREYDSIEDLIEGELRGLDFSELIVFTDEQIGEARQEFTEPSSSRFHVIAVERSNEPTFYSVWDDQIDGYYVDDGIIEEFSSEWQAQEYCRQLNDGTLEIYAIGDIIQLGEDGDAPEYRVLKTKHTAYNESGIPVTMYGYDAYWDRELQHFKLSNTDILRRSLPIKIIGRTLAARAVDFLNTYSPDENAGVGYENAVFNMEDQLKDTVMVSELIQQFGLIIPEENLTPEQLEEANRLVADLKATLPEELREKLDEKPFIAHFYVIPDLQAQGQIEVQTYPNFEEAFAAYADLPTDHVKALGVQNTNPMPGSLDFIQCRDGADVLVEDHTKVEGWDNPEIKELVSRIREQLPVEREQAPESRLDEMLRQAMLASELSEQTGQNVFAFEEGNPLPINVPAAEQPAANEGPAEKEIAPPPPASRPRERLTPTMLFPEIPGDQRHDYRIVNDSIGVGTPGERYANNVKAIRLLKRLEAEDRLATPEEQAVLAQYVGWGGLADCFEEKHSKYAELKSLLTEDEYTAARESTLTAFYTPPVVIRAMYQALENIGFKSGNMLEPSCGVGNFMGMKPDTLSDSRIFGVELDSISGRIARQLYQNSSIAVQGFEKVVKR